MADENSTATAATAAPVTPAAAPAATDTPAVPAAVAPVAVNDAAAALGAEAPKPADAPAADPNAPPVLTMPGKDATPEQWAEFYTKLGRPETADGYELPIPEGSDDAFAKQMAPLLHKHGITAEQAKGLATDWNAMQSKAATDWQAAENARITAMNTKNQAEADALKTEWGDKHAENFEFAKRAMRQFFPAEKASDVVSAIERVVGYRGVITMLHDMGKGLAEHGAPGLGEQTSGSPTKSLAERMYPNHQGPAA
jgi:hypothetical protein